MPQRFPESLPLYDECHFVRFVERSEYEAKLDRQEYRGVGSRRSLKALHIVKKSTLQLRGRVPTGAPMSYLQQIGQSSVDGAEIVARVWQHSHRALQWFPTLPLVAAKPSRNRWPILDVELDEAVQECGTTRM